MFSLCSNAWQRLRPCTPGALPAATARRTSNFLRLESQNISLKTCIILVSVFGIFVKQHPRNFTSSVSPADERTFNTDFLPPLRDVFERPYGQSQHHGALPPSAKPPPSDVATIARPCADMFACDTATSFFNASLPGSDATRRPPQT